MPVTSRYTREKSSPRCISVVKYHGIARKEMPCATPDMELASISRYMARLFFSAANVWAAKLTYTNTTQVSGKINIRTSVRSPDTCRGTDSYNSKIYVASVYLTEESREQNKSTSLSGFNKRSYTQTIEVGFTR